MSRKSYSQILDNAARDHLAEHTDLAPQIMAQIQKGKGSRMQPRMKVFVTAILVLLVIAFVLMSVPSVRAALQRWIGYVPGIGLVSEGQIRVLAEPVSLTREGITLKIEEVLVDSTRTTVVYSVEGLTVDMLDTDQLVNTPGCYQDAILRLTGEELSSTNQTGTSWITGYQHKATYPAIPSTINEVTLVMPCVRSALPGKAPENWEMPFHLIPAPPDMTAFPVIEISTPVEATSTALPPVDTSTNLEPDGISLTLDRAVQMDDGYLIFATLHWESTGFSSLDLFDPTTFHLLDANGKEIAYNFDYEAIQNLTPAQMPGRGQTAFAFRTAPIRVAGPVTLVVDLVDVTVSTDASFMFDPGPDPQPGQVWELNQDLDVGYGHSLRVLSAKYPTPPMENLPQQAGFSFDMQSETGVTNAMLFDHANPVAGGGGGGGGSSGIFSAGFSYAGAMPKGPITVTVESISVGLPGPWQAAWTPPVNEGQIVPTPQPAACLTRESWPQALQGHATLPTGLTGTLALFDIAPPTYNYSASVVKLDGSDLQSIGFGYAPSLSPDGTRVVYIGPNVDGPSDGLYIMDLASGNTTRLPGTTTGDINPLWSPDGSTIAFTRGPSSGLISAPGPYNVVVVNEDGSNLRPLTDGTDANYAMTWMPDGNRLLYMVVSRDGSSLQIIDMQTGEVSSLPGIDARSVAVSPDGKRLVLEETLPLEKYGVFVSDLDGSNRKLLADGDPYIVTVPAWSPDGNWIIASVQDPDTNKHPNPMLALIQVDTCQIIPLPNLGGYVTSWLP
jgi:Tol biopolymer transport system component